MVYHIHVCVHVGVPEQALGGTDDSLSRFGMYMAVTKGLWIGPNLQTLAMMLCTVLLNIRICWPCTIFYAHKLLVFVLFYLIFWWTQIYFLQARQRGWRWILPQLSWTTATPPMPATPLPMAIKNHPNISRNRHLSESTATPSESKAVPPYPSNQTQTITRPPLSNNPSLQSTHRHAHSPPPMVAVPTESCT